MIERTPSFLDLLAQQIIMLEDNESLLDLRDVDSSLRGAIPLGSIATLLVHMISEYCTIDSGCESGISLKEVRSCISTIFHYPPLIRQFESVHSIISL